ncbi:hypothetical protein E0Z10_g4079 [Xylaria hypoxylon]|uniref:Uncharacterized protein n=1 Tax=Xylaria hypoxylon TaxID=37992 RepID=A0A4Z0YZN7_9PEZI|nr:hypothetical protein E0Z10_g4079 [Xylaria hypoxylon]
MEPSLQSVGDIDLTPSERAIFNVLSATLQYPAKPQAKGVKLADDIYFFCNSLDEGDNVSETLWEVWSVVLDIAACIPPGHLWQDSLVLALDSLHKQDVAISKHDESLLWKDLPNLAFCVREKWSDPTCTGEDVSEEFTKWKNLNSFVARLTSTGFAPWLSLPTWQLRTAFEEPPVIGPARECRVWIASEWIIRCARPIFEDMTEGREELDESTARSLRTGPLCDDALPLSLERWQFWRKRFAELAGDGSGLGLDSVISRRSLDALNSMDAVCK